MVVTESLSMQDGEVESNSCHRSERIQIFGYFSLASHLQDGSKHPKAVRRHFSATPLKFVWQHVYAPWICLTSITAQPKWMRCESLRKQKLRLFGTSSTKKDTRFHGSAQGETSKKMNSSSKYDCPPHTLYRSRQYYVCDAIDAENIEIGPKI